MSCYTEAIAVSIPLGLLARVLPHWPRRHRCSIPRAATLAPSPTSFLSTSSLLSDYTCGHHLLFLFSCPMYCYTEAIVSVVPLGLLARILLHWHRCHRHSFQPSPPRPTTLTPPWRAHCIFLHHPLPQRPPIRYYTQTFFAATTVATSSLCRR